MTPWACIPVLASGNNPLDHIADLPWKDTLVHGAPLLSSQIAVMIVVGLLLVVLMVSAARRRGLLPRGKGYNMVEVFVLFVRDTIARDTLHENTYRFLPFLLTLFFFILFCNLFGMLPLTNLFEAVHAYGESLKHANPESGWARALVFVGSHPISGTPTSNVFVTGALAAMTFVLVIVLGVATQVKEFVHHGRNPVLGWTVGFFLYVWSLVPPLPMGIKIAMSPLLMLLELIGVVARCFALWVRLLANMSAGHILLAVLLMFTTMASGAMQYLVTPASILGSVAISMLELLVAFIQAFIFTFLTSVFIGMSVHPEH